MHSNLRCNFHYWCSSFGKCVRKNYLSISSLHSLLSKIDGWWIHQAIKLRQIFQSTPTRFWAKGSNCHLLSAFEVIWLNYRSDELISSKDSDRPTASLSLSFRIWVPKIKFKIPLVFLFEIKRCFKISLRDLLGDLKCFSPPDWIFDVKAFASDNFFLRKQKSFLAWQRGWLDN